MSDNTLPRYVLDYFWGDDLSELNFNQHRRYIIETLLERGDAMAVRWLFSVVDRHTVYGMLPSLRLSKKSMHFWHIYLA